MRSQFTFYESFARALSCIRKKADRADAYDAICNYALYGAEPEETVADSVRIAFELIRPMLDSSRRKSESGKRGGESARKEAGEDPAEKPPVSRFVPPTVEEVREYCMERGNSVDAQKFVDYYSAANWVRGKTKIKDWKACVRTWEQRDMQEVGRKETENNPFTAMLRGGS